ncbi:glutaredoxin family protein [Parathalassolituus penaei]|uniref:Glutaredoxin n=1 Tax=Parathalassolituus penaei TaxID=2997323 RepID=A0A9X3EA35_9GAMM|nr:hypothetical protein [Parathalassolituus penaei]MCY0963732.1 hypothetical protein [Parathalassolituus penaei]
MKITRQLQGFALHIADRLIPVKPVVRPIQELNTLERESRRMHLYLATNCPSSISIKRHCKRLGLRVVEKDVRRVDAFLNELVHGGGAPRVPCLRVDGDKTSDWLYSPEAILEYLERRF